MSEDNHHETVINVLTEALSVQKDTLVALKDKMDRMREDFERKLDLAQPAWANLKEVKNLAVPTDKNHQEAPEAVRAITDIHPIPLAHADGVTWFAAHSPLKPRWSRIGTLLKCDPSIGKRNAKGPGDTIGTMNCILVVDKKAPPEGRFHLLKKLC